MPDCGQHRVPKTFHTIDGSESFLDRTLGQIGVPPWDVLAGRHGLEQRFYEFAGDRGEVLGPLNEPGKKRDSPHLPERPGVCVAPTGTVPFP